MAQLKITVCTWSHCVQQPIHPQIGKDGQRWAFLCQEHHEALDTALSDPDVRKWLSAWVKAQGGPKKAMARMLGDSA